MPLFNANVGSSVASKCTELATFSVLLRSTASVIVVIPSTFSVPAIAVLPVAATTLNLLVLMFRLLVISTTP